RRPQTADRRPQTADRRPQTADRRPQTAGKYNREEFACSHRARILRTQHTPLVRQSGTAPLAR
ncbi:hypothetical protein ROM21_08845, partial [Cronobacter sakazakii]|uniref:hypothetical protein n=1 Tax=Cronobacter sakazakii TaxID=28141 RepID=UPI002894628D